jgi:hypothetical protein
MKNIFICLLVLLSVSGCNNEELPSLDVKLYPNRKNDFSLWQLEPFYGESQMGYIIRGDDKKIVIIDGGIIKAAPYLSNFIHQLGGEVDSWIITHPHHDHAGVLTVLLNNRSVKINKVIHSALDIGAVEKFEATSLAFLTEYYEALASSGVTVVNAVKGDLIGLGAGINMEVLGARNDSINVNMINNSSLVFKIKSSRKSVLILGDLGIEGGNAILKNVPRQNLAANYVQMAHHGQDGVSKEFYEAVNPQFALWPTPSWLWENNQDARGYNTGAWKTLSVRAWMEELKIQMNYVSGLEGTIQID